jgi:hypothetical protein
MTGCNGAACGAAALEAALWAAAPVAESCAAALAVAPAIPISSPIAARLNQKIAVRVFMLQRWRSCVHGQRWNRRDGFGRLYFEQLIEQGTIMHDGFAQLLGAGFVALAAHGNGLCSAVMEYDTRVVDRDVGGTMFEIGHRIAAFQH